MMPADNHLYACHVAEIASPQYAFIYNPTNKKKTKTYGLEGLYTPFRQGRSLSLPTLPFQKTNRYAVDGSMQMLFLLQTHINHVNKYAVDGSILMLFLLQTCINYANHHAVVSAK